MLAAGLSGAAPGPGDAADAAKGAGGPRLTKAAHEFEASLMQELLKPLQEDPLFAKDDSSADGSGNALSSFGTEALAEAISSRGGFGIADKILAQFRAKAAPPGGDAATDKKIPGIGRAFSTKVSPSLADDLKEGEQK